MRRKMTTFKTDFVSSNMNIITCDQCDKEINHGEKYYFDPNEEFTPVFCSESCFFAFYREEADWKLAKKMPHNINF